MSDKPRLTPKIVRMFQQWLEGKYLTRSQFSSVNAKRWLELLHEVGAISRKGSRIWLIAPERLATLLKSLGYNQPIESYLQQPQTRSQAVRLTSDSKSANVRVFPTTGAYMRSIVQVKARLQGLSVDLNLNGAWIFVYDFRALSLPADVTVVWIENFETFARIQFYPFFSSLKAAFFWTASTSEFVAWLIRQPNAYLHFGDFDLSGLAIYISEFRRKMPEKRMEFYIPPNLEQLFVRYGKTELYSRQLADPRVKSIDFSHYPEILPVFNLIQKYHKGLEQEVLEGNEF